MNQRQNFDIEKALKNVRIFHRLSNRCQYFNVFLFGFKKTSKNCRKIWCQIDIEILTVPAGKFLLIHSTNQMKRFSSCSDEIVESLYLKEHFYQLWNAASHMLYPMYLLFCNTEKIYLFYLFFSAAELISSRVLNLILSCLVLSYHILSWI